jgi:NAD-dependent dihydropyrimidine dehydrogenase PreA subunit
MTYVIAEPCIDILDKSCVDVCPVDCIYFDEGEDRMLYIHPEECIDCGACEPVCPVEAIFEESALPAQWREFLEINALWFKDKAAARVRVDAIHPVGTPPVKPLA